MKKILITGANSYIGTSFEKYMQQWPEEYQVDTVDMLNGTWREKSFVGYDVIFHVAGIAHSDSGKISEERSKMYYRVNRDLTIEVAEKAKKEGVKQFVFLSSMAVYGLATPIGKSRIISLDTPLSPDNSYGDSKKQAEEGILPMEDASFKVVILRPPMIYGPGSKGNYPTLSKLARKLPVFPRVKNHRSMLYIEHLSEFVRLMIENEEQGIFWPQNREYSNTSEVVQMIARAHNKRVLLVPGCTWALQLMSHFVVYVNKAFGSIVYAPNISVYKEEYCKYSLIESIFRTEEAE
ncbi:MAG: NAD-dependent epimerase/dehydratase family protein [Clostridia bacterium]|nr:NAD-dependent epimerase/dehydratase family protein [Clostridia bacterium]